MGKAMIVIMFLFSAFHSTNTLNDSCTWLSKDELIAEVLNTHDSLLARMNTLETKRFKNSYTKNEIYKINLFLHKVYKPFSRFYNGDSLVFADERDLNDFPYLKPNHILYYHLSYLEKDYRIMSFELMETNSFVNILALFVVDQNGTIRLLGIGYGGPISHNIKHLEPTIIQGFLCLQWKEDCKANWFLYNVMDKSLWSKDSIYKLCRL